LALFFIPILDRGSFSDDNVRKVTLKQIGQTIKEARNRLGLSQVELAQLAGVSYRPIYQIEDGKSIRLATLLQLCDALGLDLEALPRRGMSHD
jgi:y4mF family transcriptional regulator